jgi:hypothetical protein
MDKFRYHILPDKTYILNTSDNSVVEVLGADLISTYLRTKGYI